MALSNMQAIRTVTVGAGGTSIIEFTSIPQTYTDLVVYVSARNTSSFNAETALLSLNGSTSNFNGVFLQGSGSAASTGSYARFGFNMPAANSTASIFSNGYVYFPNYRSSNNKPYTFDSVTENNAAEAYATMYAGLWSNTSAITSITFTANSGNFAQHSTATLYGITNATVAGVKATGGAITMNADYIYHTFISSGTFTPTQSISADILVVAGGGGGGSAIGGGGAGGEGGAGAGGYQVFSAQSLSATNYSITVGGGGAGGLDVQGSNGSNSVFGGLTASVGGGAGGGDRGTPQVGGSGGAGGYPSATRTGANGTAGQGNKGGDGAAPTGNGVAGGGGGGAGAVGSNGNTASSPATGGVGGIGSNSFNGTYYAGGGGGGATIGGSGGVGGGGAGSSGQSGTAFSGVANTGGGGGGSGGNGLATVGGSGGSGIVIVRYAKA